MEDFTGGVTETFDLTQGNEGLSLFDRIKKSASLSSLISCSIKATTPKDAEAVLSSGIGDAMLHDVMAMSCACRNGDVMV